ncbi:MAG TPA: ATP-grasp domain-containing protein [Bacteroidales bacterium]|nr:ATP-grasp domain-containing protein [Bacteroidales bacterium]
MQARTAVIVYNEVSPDALPDEGDILDQVSLVENTLPELGYRSIRLPVGLDLNRFLSQLRQITPDIIVNLTESICNRGELLFLPPSIMEAFHFAFTGSPADALFLTTNKPLAKKWMQFNGIATPAWYAASETLLLDPSRTYVAKPAREDGSAGFDEDCVFSGKDFPSFCEKYKAKLPSYFVEEFLPGREFNVSLLGGSNAPEMLPIAEMMYEDFPDGKPKILGYTAKWKEDSFEYRHTVRRFVRSDEESALASSLYKICLQCWHIFGLKGYARIDFRLDAHGIPNVLEINANPCITPGAGFYAACEQAGYSFRDVLDRIIASSLA